MTTIVALGLLALPGEAAARHTVYFGDAAAMTGASGMALYRGGGAAWYNPAGLVGNRRNQIELSASVFILRYRDSSELVETRALGRTYHADLDAVEFKSVPAALVYKRRLSKKVHGALGVFVTDLDSYQLNDVLELTDPQGGLEQHTYQHTSIAHELQTYHFGLMLSWELHKRFRLGWGVFAVYSTLSHHFRDTTARHLEDPATGDLSELSLLSHDVSAESTLWGLQFTMGLQWQLSDHWHFGAMVRTPTVRLYHSNRLDAVVSYADGSTGTGDYNPQPDSSPVSELVTPMEAVVGLALKYERFYLGLEGELIMPIRDFTAWEGDPQGNLRIGGRFYLTKNFAMGLGAFTERSLHKDLFYVGERRMDYYGGVVGFKWRKSYSVRGRVRDDAIVFTTSLCFRYAYGVGQMLGYINDLEGQLGAGGSGTVLRDYFAHEAAVYIGSSLYF